MTTTSAVINERLQGKVAVITGGASGIGEATARLFADHGATAIVIADIQDEKGQLVAASIGSPCCTYIHCDVTDEHQVKSMIDQTIHIYGRLDIMFSNAGIVSKSEQTILDLDFRAMDRLFAINVRGMAACVKHAAQVMVKGRIRGSIVCTGSIVASVGSNRRVDYTMSKHAVLGLMRTASRQLGQYGIRVNSVSPAAVATPLMCEAWNMDPEGVERTFERFSNLKGNVLKAKHVAEAVLFLACEDSAFITGHDLIVDGGFQTPNPRSMHDGFQSDRSENKVHNS